MGCLLARGRKDQTITIYIKEGGSVLLRRSRVKVGQLSIGVDNVKKKLSKEGATSRDQQFPGLAELRESPF